MSLPMFNVRSFSLEDVIECLSDSGYICDLEEFEFAHHHNDAFKYNGFDGHNHKFLIGFKSDQSEDMYYAAKVYITLGSSGKLVADYDGGIMFNGTEDEVLDYIERTCN